MVCRLYSITQHVNMTRNMCRAATFAPS
jgi:hypothetical protein